MKLQGIAIIFALICLPIILVLSYYISLQVKTINLQNQYNSKLLDATYDAMSAFELNTANEDLSTVSDSLRTIIEASDNVFVNTLATNLGMSNASKSYIEPYIPAVLYTLYDGYYIYAPTYAPIVLTDSDGTAVAVGDLGVQKASATEYSYTEMDDKDADGNDIPDSEKINNSISYDDPNGLIKKEDYGQLLYKAKDSSNYTTSTDVGSAEYKTQNILKTYIPYSARYIQQGLKDSENTTYTGDINVVYTLDNYVTIDATFTYDDANNRKIYYTKSGYLIPFKTTKDSEGNLLSSDVSARVYLGRMEGGNPVYSNYEDTFKYNQNEVQEYIEAGNPVKVEIAKSSDLNEYETVIEINSGNSAIIDTTNTNPNSDTVILTKYKNLVFNAKECISKIQKGLILPTPNPDNDSYTLADIEFLNNLFSKSRDELETEYGLGEAKDHYDANPTLNKNGLINFINTMIIDKVSADINEREYKVQLNSAAVYYAKASIFSKWVADNLSGLKAENIKDISGLNYTTYSEVAINDAVGDENNYLKIWKSSGNVFEFSDGHDDCGTTEIKKDSSYYDHKLNVIRCSIQYNLNLAMSSYNRHVYYNDSEDDFQENANKVEEYKNTVNSTTKTRNTYTDYAMPIMKESEWEQILSNISVVSFMQGFKCGLKVYNNYVVVSSSNNEIMATPENIYYAKKDEFNDENAEYHKYNCNKLIENDSNDEYISFTSKEVKYDKLSSNSASHPYWYDHKNLACYECINDGNYDGKDIFDTSDMTEFNTYSNIRKAFYIGVAKERNNIYKMNAIKKSEGYEILFSKENINTPSIVNYTSSILDIDKVKAIEFVFGAVNVDRRDETSLTFGVTYGGRNLKEQPNNPGVSKLYSIPTNTTNYYTWNVEVDPLINNSNKFTLNSLNFNNVSDTTSFTGDLKNSIILIRIIYK